MRSLRLALAALGSFDLVSRTHLVARDASKRPGLLAAFWQHYRNTRILHTSIAREVPEPWRAPGR